MITLEVRETGKAWGTISHFTEENKLVTAGLMSRDKLVALAQHKARQWSSNYDRDWEYRVFDSAAVVVPAPSDEEQKAVVGIENTASNPRYDVWRLTFDGHVLGDSRGYSRVQATQEAKAQVARNPGAYVLHHELS